MHDHMPAGSDTLGCPAGPHLPHAIPATPTSRRGLGCINRLHLDQRLALLVENLA